MTSNLMFLEYHGQLLLTQSQMNAMIPALLQEKKPRGQHKYEQSGHYVIIMTALGVIK